MRRGIVLQICSKLIKMGSLELGLSRVPMSADFIDPLYSESSHCGLLRIISGQSNCEFSILNDGKKEK